MLTEALIAAFLGAILCLDRIFVQAMISRPIVVAPAIGWVLNEPSAGLTAGALLELFWADRTAVGAYVPPNESLAAILIAGSVSIVAHQTGGASREHFVLCFLFFLPFGILGGKMDAAICRWNSGLSDAALRDADKGDHRSVGRRHLTAMGRTFLAYSLFLFLSLSVGCYFLLEAASRLSPEMIRAFGLSYRLLPLIGLAVALKALSSPRAVHVFCAVYLIVFLIAEMTRAS